MFFELRSFVRVLLTPAAVVVAAAPGCTTSSVTDASKTEQEWQGAPCEECDLPTQLSTLADDASKECPKLALNADDMTGAVCAHAAFAEGRPFTLVVEEAGIDSLVLTAWVYANGRLDSLLYDSNVCGGSGGNGPACSSKHCGPSIQLTPCTNPKGSATRDVFTCSEQSDTRVICGPVSG